MPLKVQMHTSREHFKLCRAYTILGALPVAIKCVCQHGPRTTSLLSGICSVSGNGSYIWVVRLTCISREWRCCGTWDTRCSVWLAIGVISQPFLHFSVTVHWGGDARRRTPWSQSSSDSAMLTSAFSFSAACSNIRMMHAVLLIICLELCSTDDTIFGLPPLRKSKHSCLQQSLCSICTRSRAWSS